MLKMGVREREVQPLYFRPYRVITDMRIGDSHMPGFGARVPQDHDFYFSESETSRVGGLDEHIHIGTHTKLCSNVSEWQAILINLPIAVEMDSRSSTSLVEGIGSESKISKLAIEYDYHPSRTEMGLRASKELPSRLGYCVTKKLERV